MFHLNRQEISQPSILGRSFLLFRLSLEKIFDPFWIRYKKQVLEAWRMKRDQVRPGDGFVPTVRGVEGRVFDPKTRVY